MTIQQVALVQAVPGDNLDDSSPQHQTFLKPAESWFLFKFRAECGEEEAIIDSILVFILF